MRTKKCDTHGGEAFDYVSVESGMPINYLLFLHQYFFGIVDENLLPHEATEADREEFIQSICEICRETKAKQKK